MVSSGGIIIAVGTERNPATNGGQDDEMRFIVTA